jgi:adenosylcobinamide kinase/adenosylcobinamide-phosphate guanylyltransferase
MRLIIGGAYQGKLEFAMEKYHQYVVAEGSTCSVQDVLTCGILNRFEIFIKRNFSNVEEVSRFLDRLLSENPHIIVVCNEVGCGVVPVEKSERAYRELVGRACCEVSKRAETVERVFCGLGVCVKC